MILNRVSREVYLVMYWKGLVLIFWILVDMWRRLGLGERSGGELEEFSNAFV